MNWLIVEDALRDRKGHWLEYVSTFVRELRALGDEVLVLCDRKAQGFVMEQTGARPVLPESIWHRMGDGAGAAKRYLRVPGHAIATFFAIRKVCRGFNHEKTRKDTKGEGEKAESGNAEKLKLNKESTEEAGLRLAGQAGAAFSNPFTSELARDSENTSLIRSADNPSSLPATIHPQPDTAPEAQALDTGRWSLDSGEAPDWIFVPTVLVHHLLGWWLLLKTGSVPQGSRVLLFFPNLPIRLDDEGQPHWTGGPTTKLMAWLFAQLRGEVENGKVVLGVETYAMRRALEGLIRMPVAYLPHPVEAKLGQREASDGAGVPAEAQRRGDFLRNHERHEIARKEKAGQCLVGQAGASEPDSLTSKLADAPVSESLSRFADGPVGAAQPPRTDCGPLEYASHSTGERGLIADSAGGAKAFVSGRSILDSEASAKPIVFGCYGAARWEKGSDIFQEAIKRILKNEVASAETTGVWGCAGEPANGSPKGESRGSDRGNRVSSAQNQSATGLSEPVTNYLLPAAAVGRPLRFAIQWVEDFREDSGNLISIDPLLQGHSQVEVIGRYFEGDEYERRLAATDVMVLPYRKPYQLRVSRVVIEAMLSGMPVISTRGTTLFEQAEEYGVVVGCEEGNAESLAGAMLEVAESFESLRMSAAEKMNTAVGSFSVACFRQLLMKLKINKVCQ